MNATDTQLGDPINSGLTRWRMYGGFKIYKWTPPRNSGGIPKVSTIFNLSMEMGRLTRDGTAEPVSPDQILRRERGQGNIHFPCSADHEQDWQPYPVDPYSCYICGHTYIHTKLYIPRLEGFSRILFRCMKWLIVGDGGGLAAAISAAVHDPSPPPLDSTFSPFPNYYKLLCHPSSKSSFVVAFVLCLRGTLDGSDR